MDINYRILWIEDSEDYVESTVGVIKKIVSESYMSADIKTYESFSEFEKGELEPFDLDVFNLYDVILVDFALSGSSGDHIIREIRNRKIYTDIVFYSSNYESMISTIKEQDQMDGVFFARRENLTNALINVVKKNLKREYSIANIRGLMMEGTSDFDFICRTTAIDVFAKLTPEQKKEVCESLMSYVDNAKKKATDNFDEIIRFYNSNLDKFLAKTLKSTDYVMDNKDRYMLFAQMLQLAGYNLEFSEQEATCYNENLIQPRNKLAHSKVFYGACKKKVHIANERGQVTCNQDCKNCKTPYDIEKCENIRKLIYKYYLIFKQIDART